MLPLSPRFSNSLCREARTLSAPDALHPLPAQTEMQGRVVSEASRHSRISLSSWCALSFCIACLVRLHGRLLIFAGIFLQQTSNPGLGQVGMSVAVIHPSDRGQPAASDAAHGLDGELQVGTGSGSSHLQISQDPVQHTWGSAYVTRRSQADLNDMPASRHQAEAAVESCHLVNLGQGHAQLLRYPPQYFLWQIAIGFLDFLKHGNEIALTIFECLEQRFHFLHINLRHGGSL